MAEQVRKTTEMVVSGAEFHRKEELTTRLRDLIRKYPFSSQIAKEVLQNADDAYAKSFKLVWDKRTLNRQSLLTPGLGAYQGPAIICFNDAEFREKDFSSLQNLRDSVKVSEDDKAGQFGIGFNSVFNITDVPSIISGKNLVVLDPHSRILFQGNHYHDGLRWDYTSQLQENEPTDQFDGYRVFGFSSNKEFKGTIFRLPIRNGEHPKSAITDRIYSDQEIDKLFEDIITESELMILFLKNIISIEIYKWEVGENAPVLLHEVTVNSRNSTFLDYTLKEGFRNNLPLDEKIFSNLLSINVNKKISSRWLICQKMGSKEANQLAASGKVSQKTIPWGEMAFNLTIEGQRNVINKPIRGKYYCFLPMPIFSPWWNL